jgi:RimJ/RimL family protein N-acetyltransferase
VSALRPPETFTTGRLTLRPLALADAPAIFGYASDAEATRFMNFPRHRAMSEAEAFARRCVEE